VRIDSPTEHLHPHRRALVLALVAMVASIAPWTTERPADAAGPVVPHITTLIGGLGRGPALQVAQWVAGLAVGGRTLYVADGRWNVVRAIDLDTSLERVVAGTGPLEVGGEVASDDAGDGGPATAARLRQPQGIAVAGDGSLLIAETGAHRIRRVAPDGTISTVAGNGTAGFSGDGQPAGAGQLRAPESIAVDVEGAVLIADTGNGRLRRVAPDGTMATLATFDNAQPSLVVVEHDRDAVVAVRVASPNSDFQPRLVRVSPTGAKSPAVTGMSTPGGVTSSVVWNGLPPPTALAIDAADHLYLPIQQQTSELPAVHEVTDRGALGPAWGSCGVPVSPGVGPLAVGPDGALYSGDGAGPVCRLAKPGTGAGTIVAGRSDGNYSVSGQEATDAQIAVPMAVRYAPNGELVVAEQNDGRILRRRADGTAVTIAGGGTIVRPPDGTPATSASLGSPYGLAVGSDGLVMFTDGERVRRIGADGRLRTVAGMLESGFAGDGLPATQARLSAPGHLAIAGDGTVYIADRMNRRVRKVAPNGIISTFAGNGGFENTGDGGPATAAGVPYVTGLAIAPDGAVLISSGWQSGSAVRRVAPDGTISTLVAGEGGDLAFDGLGRVLVAEPWAHQVKRVDAGVVTVVAGTGTPGESGDGGPATAATLYYPNFLAVAPDGSIAVSGLARVRQIRDPGVPDGPTGVIARARDHAARVSWDAPSSDGASRVTGYAVTASPSGMTATVSGSARAAVVTGLPNGTAQTFTVRATNGVGPGPASGVSGPVTPQPATLASPVRNPRVVTGNGAVTVTWDPPAFDGNHDLAGYNVSLSVFPDEMAVPVQMSRDVGPATFAATFAGIPNGNTVVVYLGALGGERIQVGSYRYPDTSAGPELVVDPGPGLTTTNAFGSGYWLAASDGGIFSFGDAGFYGSTGAIRLAKPIVGMVATPDDRGYWLVASDGGVFTFGTARFFGSTGAIALTKPIVGMAVTPTGGGYWLVASDGGIFAFGDAVYLGSMGGKPLNRPIVGMAANPDGRGYWMVASDGGVFCFGTSQIKGSMGGRPLQSPVVGMAATPNSRGYWLVAADGGIFGFGRAGFFGSLGATRLNRPIVSLVPTPTGKGYRLVASDGGTFAFGDAAFLGSTGAIHLNKPIVA
jgi:hypothetical protein